MQTLTLIDGSGYIFRAYHALPPLTNPQGVPVGAVYGFISILMKQMEGKQSDCVAVVFDAGRKTFRNDLYPEYKAHRPPAPEDLIPQFALTREAAQALNLAIIEAEGYEADDIIATYTRMARERGMSVTIVSSDKDLMQLVGEGVEMLDPMKQKPIRAAEVMEKFQVPPEKVVDVLSLIGDSSDNVPGVPGIGPKTAAELITQYGSLEALLERAGEIPQNKRRETIQAHADKARLSKQLITLHTEVPGLPELEHFACCKPNETKISAFLEQHGFRTLIARFKGKFGNAAPSSTPANPTDSAIASLTPAPMRRAYTLVQDADTLKIWLEDARKRGMFAFDTETTGLDPLTAELIGFSLCSEAGKACYVPVGHVGSAPAGASEQQNDAGPLFASPAPVIEKPKQIQLQEALALIRPVLEDASILKIGHNIKYDMRVMRKYGVSLHAMDDTMMISYALDAGKNGHGMDELAALHLGYQTITYDEVTGTGKSRISFSAVALEKACEYAAEDADITLQLHEKLRPRLFENHMLGFYESIERPLIEVIATMEDAGIRVDATILARISHDLGLKIHVLEEEIQRLAGRPFNIGSPKQLGEVLFDEQKCPGGKKSSKTGAYSTDNQVLEELSEQGYEIATKVIEWRQLSKLVSTYTERLPEQINPVTRRIHTNFAMAIAATGRLSSSDPNLQNIPIRTTEGKKIREAFIARPGYKLISADYSQIELRLLAHMADIAPLKEAFRTGQDIHAITASQMFGVPVTEISGDLRRKAKTINFGIIYGISAHGLATRLGIGRAEAAQYIERYFEQYPGIRAYMEVAKEEARKHGYITTLFGRRCHIQGINDKNGARRQFADRQAINAPLQGSAADIIKRAMIAIHRHLSENPMGQHAQMLLQVHDELIMEAEEAYAQEVAQKIKQLMESAAHLSVPLTVEAGIGNNWGEIH